MQRRKWVTLVSSALLMGMLACGGQQGSKEGKEYTSAYICPMHCQGSGSDEVGKCPVCHMDYVANEDHEQHKSAE